MTTAQTAAKSTAHQAANSRSLELLTRIGFIGYGVVHLVVAWLAVQIATGDPAREGDQTGAFAELAEHTAGRVLLVVTMVGLAAMAVWQGLLAVIGHREETGAARVWQRVGSAARAVVYAVLAVSAGRAAFGNPSSSAGKQEGAAAGVMGHAWGPWLVGLVGLGVAGLGIGLAVYGIARKFERRLKQGEMSATARKAATATGMTGYVAKGVAYGIVGVLLLQAAWTHDPDKSRGLDAALRTLAAQPYGGLLLGLVAAGIAAFGAYCFFQSRYRKV
ncbi:DUF1206 domain-containing protein [Luedemannella helvata]|uniref:DUF1206 domain-containing protein n=2 Tax=Luedemannella helvata TaxID=349315 RepID=A0ABN2KT23_9ACTN